MSTEAQDRAAAIKALRDDHSAKTALLRVLAFDLFAPRHMLETSDASDISAIAFSQGKIAAMRSLQVELEMKR